MYQGKHIYGSGVWKHRLYTACMLGMLCLVLLGIPGHASVAYADGAPPGGNISDPVVRAVDIAKPAVVRIITLVVGRINVFLPNGQNVTFPTTSQNGFHGYPLTLSGTGAFVSAHGDLLTADHVVNPPKDDLDQFLAQVAGQDVADYINRNLKPTQPVSGALITEELASGQLQSTSQYDQPSSVVYLSTEFSGSLTATSFRNIPSAQFAPVDQIKQQSVTSQKDVAIIHVSGMDNMPMLQLGDSSAVQQQDNLTIIGFPGNGDVSNNPSDLLTSSVNQVFVSSMKTTDSGAPVIQVGGNVEQGDSGGPALDAHGHIVGIVSFGVAATSGSTSFLQASNSAKQLLQAANIDTTPSAFQQAWSKAFNDYAALAPGHWHVASLEFQQLAKAHPNFKALTPFLDYANTQAQTEQQPSPSGTASPTSTTGGINPMYIVIGGAAALVLILLVSGMAISRRRKPAVPASSPAIPGYPPLSNNGAGQSYGTPSANAPAAFPPAQSVPQTPPYAAAPAYQRPAAYSAQPGYQAPPATPGYQPQPAPQAPAGMAAFGAPNPVPAMPQVTSDSSDVTLVAPRSGSSRAPSPQWRTWPCGHTNRADARFCGICGEAAPSAGRYEQ